MKQKNWKKMLGAAAVCSLLMAVPAFAEYTCTTPVEGTRQKPVKGTWSQDGQGTRFTAEDGQVYASHWLYYSNDAPEYDHLLGVWCYFDENGYMLRDQFLDLEGNRFYLGEDGVLKKNWFVKGGYLYNAGLNGVLYTSANYPPGKYFGKDGKSYRFDAEGHAVSKDGEYDEETKKELAAEQAAVTGEGWKAEGNQWTYWKNGQQVFRDWVQEEGKWYYLDEKGFMVEREIREIQGALYSFQSDGSLRTSGTERYQGSRYDILSDGRLKAWGEDAVLSEHQILLNRSFNPYADDPTVQWINATYGILTHANGGNVKAFGGVLLYDETTVPYTQAMYQQMLVSWWNITDRASADLVLEQLVANGNAAGSAWDYSRAMSNLGYYYLAGYYSQTEAMDKALEVARVIQTRFDSWDSYNQSYLDGYNQWKSSDDREREPVLAELKASPHNPFAIDWNQPLEKRW